jgi:hypothetical protein
MIAVTKAWLIAIWAIVVVSPFVTIGILKVSESRGHADIQKAIPWLRGFRRLTCGIEETLFGDVRNPSPGIRANKFTD